MRFREARMYTCACMRVCMCLCAYALQCACVCMRVCACAYALKRVCICVRLYVRDHEYTLPRELLGSGCVNPWKPSGSCTGVHAIVHAACMWYACMRACVRIDHGVLHAHERRGLVCASVAAGGACAAACAGA